MPTEVLRKPQPPLQGEDVERLFETCRRSEIGAIKAWYASEFDTRLTEISEVLRTEIAAQLRAQFVLELETRVTSLQNEYEQRQGTPVLIEEIVAVQERLDKVEVELDNRLTDDSFPLGAILRIRGEKLELSSYLRGLEFAAKALGNRG